MAIPSSVFIVAEDDVVDEVKNGPQVGEVIEDFDDDLPMGAADANDPYDLVKADEDEEEADLEEFDSELDDEDEDDSWLDEDDEDEDSELDDDK